MSAITNVAAPNVPYFTPHQSPPAGTLLSSHEGSQSLPKVFQPLKIRDVEFPNRIFLSPLCQYSAQDGHVTPWHMAHLGGILTRGPGLTMIEATAVVPEGRITPEDVGIWSDSHITSLKQIVDFAHSQSQKIGIQLAHAGRKASTVAPWLSFAATAEKEANGWPDNVWGPSPIKFSEGFPEVKELSTQDVKNLVKEFGKAAQRAITAGFDVIEVHAAHGYLLCEFLSPVSNKRTDEYGGSFEGRSKFLLEVVDEVRRVIPQGTPVFVRVSATEWLEESLPNEASWKSEDTVRLSHLLVEHGVDLLDVSTGGNHPKQQISKGPLGSSPAYQAPFSHDVKKSFNSSDKKLLVGAVGSINTGTVAEDVLQKEQADIVFVGRAFQKNPGLVWDFAEELGVQTQVAHQIGWGFFGRGGGKKAASESTKL